jgi:hypothetical protein
MTSRNVMLLNRVLALQKIEAMYGITPESADLDTRTQVALDAVVSGPVSKVSVQESPAAVDPKASLLFAMRVCEQQDICDVLGVSESTAKKLKDRAISIASGSHE